MTCEQNSEKQNAQDPRAIANYFIEVANKRGEKLSILQLIKLVYFAHGWCLGFGHGPLINAPVKAWKAGPVIDEVYDHFRPHGVHEITKPVPDADGNPLRADLTDEQKEIVDRVYRDYAHLHPFTLSRLTYARATPWAMTRGHYAPIDNKVIEDYYRKMSEKLGQENREAESR